jgi:mRNA-degrading endonuclease RelE of RelBE toxin-antitoxin system
MRTYRVEWARKALKQLMKIQKNDRISIANSVKQLANWPDCQNVKPLKNHQYQYRLRVGRFRIFFDVENSVKIVKVEDVKKRDERTY